MFKAKSRPQSADVTETVSDIVYRNRFALRHQQQPPAPQQPERTTEPVTMPPPRRRRRSGRGMFYVVLTILFLFALFMMWKQVVTPWWNGVQDQWHYGDNPVTVYDADVGHGGVSHFIAEYYRGTIVIVELPSAAFTKYQVYVLSGYYGAGNPIILLATAPGQQPGKPNLVVSIEGTGYGRTLYNTGNSFRENAP